MTLNLPGSYHSQVIRKIYSFGSPFYLFLIFAVMHSIRHTSLLSCYIQFKKGRHLDGICLCISVSNVSERIRLKRILKVSDFILLPLHPVQYRHLSLIHLINCNRKRLSPIFASTSGIDPSMIFLALFAVAITIE